MTTHQKITRCATLFVALFFVSAACEKETAAPQTKQPEAVPEAKAQPPLLPSEPGKLSPSFASNPHDVHYDVDTHMAVGQCTSCHGEIVEEWGDSIHALASMSNPFYRFAFESFAKEAGRDKAGFCGGCHDPALMFDQSIKVEINPRSDQAHAGISCNTCHGIEGATIDGNASYMLSTAPVPIPKNGDDASLAAHLKRVGGAKLRANELCVSCHKVFLSPDSGHDVLILGLDEWGPWRRSAYSGNQTTRITSIKPQNCVDCHMPEVELPSGKSYRSHRFPGSHTTLAHMTKSTAQIEAVEKMVKSAATLDVSAYGLSSVSPTRQPIDSISADQKLWFDIVIFNENAGHFFPGGAQDLRDTWLEVEIHNSKGERLAGAGLDHAETGKDSTAHVLQALMTTDEGDGVGDHAVQNFRTVVYNHTIAPRDASVVRYEWTPSKDVKGPFTVTARLQHRRLTKSFQNGACNFSKTDPAHAEFTRQGTRYRDFDADPCAEQPIVEAATTSAVLDGKELEGKAKFIRFYQRGLGLEHHVQESLQEALDSFDVAIAAAPDAHAKAMALFEKGRVTARLGRTEDAMDLFAMAEKTTGPHPAIHYARGRAHHRVFRFDDAVKWYVEASKLQDDDRIWRQLAIAAGSVSDTKTSLEAAQKGLKIEPRDPHLLRNQMLALNQVEGTTDEWKAKAKDAFSRFKRDEAAPNIRDKCSEKSADCRDGRLPIQHIVLK